ncbi:site-specific integrase [Arthrobacter sp. ISL-95]|uniref:site-specific integrase n=1 Tax=Arthrobacter sp. ISL-95 TaxID=2819116 RepID=UPI001BE8A263|nr:site-specific integrase [Arthrobacter sp. ISL-95]MBT2586449.1 site-specific integrase [Arthrobacter sp. ISL-95]
MADRTGTSLILDTKVLAAVQDQAKPELDLPARWFGDLSSAAADTIADTALRIWPHVSEDVQKQRHSSVRLILTHLADHPGQTWQQRWEASGLNRKDQRVGDLEGLPGESRGGRRERLTRGFRMILCMRLIRPTLPALTSNRVIRLADTLRQAERDPRLDEFFKRVAASHHSAVSKRHALHDVAATLLTQGLSFAQLTPEALLRYGLENMELIKNRRSSTDNRLVGKTAWSVLCAMGQFPPLTPPTPRACLGQRQLTSEELVDRHDIRNQPIRLLLINYLERKRQGLDYSTIWALSLRLSGLFWQEIEKLSPEQTDLRIPVEIYQRWKAGLQVRGDGGPRKAPEHVLASVRSFYLDLRDWAMEEPERWGIWVVPCPIAATELRGMSRRAKEATQRMAGRTRERQPLLPALVQHVESRLTEVQSLLSAASNSENGQSIRHGGRQWQRTNTQHDRQAVTAGVTHVRVRDTSTGEIRNLGIEEDLAFWTWASVEVLRHAGVRIEEMLELTELSIRQYQRPSGEVIGLLVIAPSKTDRERVVPMSAELFHVLASILRRHRRNAQRTRIIRRYDPHERIWSEPLPFLFQRTLSGGGVLGAVGVNQMLQRTCRDLGKTNPAFKDVAFTPHDFRRIFATDLINAGLPIHIGARLLGHVNLQTTQGYVAVFEEDTVRHYQDFLARRRQQRPTEEYHDVSRNEWAEFEEHFDKRRVELGSCARPYAAPCKHEHACIRCPMLQVDPRMYP